MGKEKEELTIGKETEIETEDATTETIGIEIEKEAKLVVVVEVTIARRLSTSISSSPLDRLQILLLL